MPSNNNSPALRNLRSNSQNELTLSNVKLLIDASKNEVIGALKAEIQSLRQSISVLSSRVDKLEEENKSLQAQCQQALSQSGDGAPSFEDSWPEIVNELQQRDRRKLNLIIFGAAELVTGSVPERRAADREKATEIFAAIGIPNCPINGVSRIGALSDKKNRLLRVAVTHEEDRRYLLSNSRLLRQVESFKNIFIKPDLTPLQQKLDFKLRKELQESKSSNPEKDFIIYRGRVVERSQVQDFRK